MLQRLRHHLTYFVKYCFSFGVFTFCLCLISTPLPFANRNLFRLDSVYVLNAFGFSLCTFYSVHVFARERQRTRERQVKANKVLVIRTTNNLINSGPVIRTVFLTDQLLVFTQNSLFIIPLGPNRSVFNASKMLA